MTIPDIAAVLFDVGGTLRGSAQQDEDVRDQNIRELMKLIGSNENLAPFYALLKKRSKAYHSWADETHVELNEAELWTLWMLPDYSAQQIKPQAVTLNELWRNATRRRDPYPETKAVIEELFRRGYRLGVVSNTTSSTEAPELLAKLQITQFFEVVILSCQVGRRKGEPDMLLEAASRMGIPPENCAYVGNQPNRDVVAARRAGFSKTILLNTSSNAQSFSSNDPYLVPDYHIDNLTGLLDIFPRLPTASTIIQP